MTYEESIPVAKQLAEKAMAKGFDVEAFLVLSEIKRLEQNNFPDTEVDDYLININQLFSQYYENHSDQNLAILLNTIRRMLSELYYFIEPQQKEIFLEHLQDIQNIVDT